MGKLNKEIEIVDAKGKCLGKFDEIDLENKIYYEDKTAKELDTVNSKTGKPTQTAQQFADKQIYTKTKNRINNLANSTGVREAKVKSFYVWDGRENDLVINTLKALGLIP
uniref:hypothetical protein n=1 Tax=Enterocloster clostridioformis TaxID=1531 RepID=UPI0026754F55|nr:hypothetical protein [Enterocloster clostridioformis]